MFCGRQKRQMVAISTEITFLRVLRIKKPQTVAISIGYDYRKLKLPLCGMCGHQNPQTVAESIWLKKVEIITFLRDMRTSNPQMVAIRLQLKIVEITFLRDMRK